MYLFFFIVFPFWFITYSVFCMILQTLLLSLHTSLHSAGLQAPVPPYHLLLPSIFSAYLNITFPSLSVFLSCLGLPSLGLCQSGGLPFSVSFPCALFALPACSYCLCKGRQIPVWASPLPLPVLLGRHQ